MSAAVTEPNSFPLSAAVLAGSSTGAQALKSGLQLIGVLKAANGLDLAGPADRVGLALARPGWRAIASPRGSR